MNDFSTWIFFIDTNEYTRWRGQTKKKLKKISFVSIIIACWWKDLIFSKCTAILLTYFEKWIHPQRLSIIMSIEGFFLIQKTHGSANRKWKRNWNKNYRELACSAIHWKVENEKKKLVSLESVTSIKQRIAKQLHKIHNYLVRTLNEHSERK